VDPATFRARLATDLAEAMRTRDPVATSVARTLAAAISNAEAVESPHGSEAIPFGTAEVSRREISIGDIDEIVERELEERTSVLGVYEQHEDLAHGRRLRSEIELLSSYLEFVRGP
jgi:uncharacterized protein YqeY